MLAPLGAALQANHWLISTSRNPETLIRSSEPRSQLQRFVRFCYYAPQL